MKTVLFSIVALALLGLLAYVVMAIMSQKLPNDIGLQDNVLRPCPDSPNCICSETHSQTDAEHYIKPIHGDKATWDKLKVVVQNNDGIIQEDTNTYLHITFSTPIFHFVDDMELRWDKANSLIHVRSASRIGSKDFGVNRKRMNTLKQALYSDS